MPPPIPRPNSGTRQTSFAGSPSVLSRGAQVAPPPIPPARISVLSWVCFGLSLLMAIGVTACLVLLMLPGSDIPKEPDASSTAKDLANSRQIIHSDQLADAPNVPSVQSERESSTDVNEDQGDLLSDRTASTVKPTVNSAADVAKKEEPPAFEDLRRRNFQLELPGLGEESDFNEARLAKVPIRSGELMELALLHRDGSNFSLVQSGGANSNATVWKVSKLAQVEFGSEEEVTVGQFVYRGGDLHFQWNADTPAWAKSGSLRFVPLEIRVGAMRQICQLWKPLSVTPVRIGGQKTTSAKLPLLAHLIDRPKAFRVEYQLVMRDKSELPAATVALGESAKISVGDEGQVEVQLQIVTDPQQSSVQVQFYGNPPLTKDGNRGPRQEISSTSVEEHLRLAKSKNSKKLEGEIARQQTQQTKLQKMMETVKSAGAAEQYQALEKQAEVLDAKIAKLETEAATMQRVIETNVEWCQKVGEILRNLEDETQLHFAIYLATDPRTVVIKTSGYDSTKK